jgi:transcriptional regulator GlxA family with amidase domain
MHLAIGLYDGFTALDVIGPYQVFANVPGVDITWCADRTGLIHDDTGALQVQVDATFDDVPSPDILLVGGGIITRRLAEERAPVVGWIEAAHPNTTWTTSVCTGSLLLGAAGVLEGQPATTHWCSYEALAGYGATPTEQRVVRTGKVVTGAGVSAGIDMALTLVGLMEGADLAEAVQLGIEYDPQPPYDAGAPSKARPEIRGLIEMVVKEAEANLSRQ